MKPLKKIIRAILLSNLFLYFFGSKLLFKLFFRNKLVVFLFHEISFKPSKFYHEYNLNINPKLFEKQIEFISKNFKIIHAKELFKKNNKNPSALITFDDGSIGVFKNAIKFLKYKKYPCIIFINISQIKNEIFWPGLVHYLDNNFDKFKNIVNPKNKKHITGKEFLYAHPEHVKEFFKFFDENKITISAKKYYGKFGSLNDLKKISKSKLFCFGNHLYNHYNSLVISQKLLIDNYTKNKNEMNFLENYIDYFSYPFGQKDICYNNTSNEIILNNGSKAIFTSNPNGGFNKQNMIFHRFSMDESFTSEKILLAKLNYRRIINLFQS